MRSQEVGSALITTLATRWAFAFVGLFVGISGAQALERAPAGVTTQAPLAGVPVCAVLDDFDGKIQLLDSSRAFVIDTEPNAAIPCGGWISVQTGWAKVIHRDGYRLQIGAGTFLQFARPEEEEPLVLYRGQFLLDAGNGSEEVTVLTANARIRQKSGRSLVIYSEASEESQLISVEKTATIESRFEARTLVPVRVGHLSALNQKALRLLPTPPAAVTIVQLKSKLRELGIPSRNISEAVSLAQLGQERRIQDTRSSRKPAGLVFNPSSYARHQSRPEDPALNRELEARATGGVERPKTLLYPKKLAKASGVARTTAAQPRFDPLVGLDRKKKKEEEQERVRLLDALSRVRAE